MRERLQAAAPALAALCCGRQVAPAERLRRNVALHAAGLPSPDAPLAAWRHAQHGPRLGGVQLVDKESLSEDQKCTVEVVKIIRQDFSQQIGPEERPDGEAAQLTFAGHVASEDFTMIYPPDVFGKQMGRTTAVCPCAS